MVRAIPGRRTFHELAGTAIRQMARRGISTFLRGLGDAALSDSLAQLAANAGFSDTDAPIAAAIALAESGGNPLAVGDNGTSFGLWQIHTPAHPEFQGWNLLDPAMNAQAAYRVYRAAGNSFQPWTTFRTGGYRQFLAETPAVAPGGSVLTIDAATGQPVEDSTPTPSSSAYSPSPVYAGSVNATTSAQNALVLAGLAAGAAILGRVLWGD